MNRLKLYAVCLAAFMVSACNMFDVNPGGPAGGGYSDVAILFAAGFNNLSGDLAQNVRTIESGPLPGKESGKAVVVCTHNTVGYGDYDTGTSPVIFRIYADWSGEAQRDTLLSMNPGERVTDPDVMRRMLEFVKNEFPSLRYHLVYSSHGTGYLPENYYDDFAYTEEMHWDMESSGMLRESGRRTGYVAGGNAGERLFRMRREGETLTKSIGCEAGRLEGKLHSYEMELRDFPSAVPSGMHFSSIIFDACLMGGVEVAYELRGVCDFMGFSQTEVLTAGYDYRHFSSTLLGNDPLAFCRKTFERYDKRDGVSSRSATISFIDCGKMDSLATVCADLFEKYSTVLDTLSKDSVQGFYRGGHPWFFDLQDVIAKCGASAAELDRVSAALDRCVLYKAATPTFMGEIDINTHCGLSMLMPSQAEEVLAAAYKKLSWNRETLLIR